MFPEQFVGYESNPTNRGDCQITFICTK
jgi:hypothetical protein